jgi:alkylation response protein AidB-like acyl-CoA dehydrogenase
MQRHYRDARLLTIGGGTSEIMRNVISRSVLADVAHEARERGGIR